MKNEFIGREKELQILDDALKSREAEMVAVLGRRRVGKTFMIRHAYENQIIFEAIGVQNAPLKEQLQNFKNRLVLTFGEDPKKLKFKNWLDVFQALTICLERTKTAERKVLFFDELPWFDSHKSGFVRALGHFWNSYAVTQNLVMVICGSAASWMIQNIVNDRGGLHNRITKRIDLYPFNLQETELYFKSLNLNFERYQILQFYMAMGGVPHYLKEIKTGFSPAENIDRICFAPSGVLRDEFSRLYPALFEDAGSHLAVIKTLAQKWMGMSRAEIVKLSKLTDGGAITRVLDELIWSGFVSVYYPFGKQKKEALYRLTDEYSMFYLHFIESKRFQESGVWEKLSQTATYKSWCGYAFEGICLKHLPQIKRALGISGVYSEASTFYFKGNQDYRGIQIDLLIDRNDQVINLFEIKFLASEWLLDKSTAAELRERLSIFKWVTKTKKQVFLTTLTSFGVRHTENSLGLIDRQFDMNILFETGK